MEPLMRKGVAPAVIIVATIILAAVGLVATTQVSEPEPADPLLNTKADAENAISRGVSIGVREFALYGYSNERDGTPVWYCNSAFPPDIDELRRSLTYWIDHYVREYLDGIEDESDLSVEGPTAIHTNLDDLTSIDQLAAESGIEVEFEGLTIGLEEEDRIVEQDVQTSYSLPFNWDVFLEMRAWLAEDDAGSITERLYDEIAQGICAERACCCGPEDDDDYVDEEQMREDYGVKADDVRDSLEQTIEELNDRFAGTGVSCTYQLLPESDVRTDIVQFVSNERGCQPTCAGEEQGRNHEITRNQNDEFSYGDGGVDLQQYDSRFDDHFKGVTSDGKPREPGDTRYEDYLPAGGCPVPLGESGGVVQRQRYPAPAPFNVYPPMEPIDKLLEESGEFEDELEGDEGSHTQEMVGLSKKVGLLYAITCEDPSITLEGAEGFTALRSTIYVRMAVQSVCPPPDPDESIPTEECGGGGSGPPGAAGPDCNALDCVHAYGGDDECWLCVSRDGGEGGLPECMIKDAFCGVCGRCQYRDAVAECVSGAAPPGIDCSIPGASYSCETVCEDTDGDGLTECVGTETGTRCHAEGGCITVCDPDAVCADPGEGTYEGSPCTRDGQDGVCMQAESGPFKGYFQCEIETTNPPPGDDGGSHDTS